MIRLKDDETLNSQQKSKFKQTLVEMYGKQKRKSKKCKPSKSTHGKTPAYKIYKAFKNLG